jgi:alpha-L-rhamnosidase
VQRQRSVQLATAVNALLTRPDGVYIDGLDANGAQSPHASQEANALALAYGVVPPANVARVAAYVASLGIKVEPNHGLELMRALAAADMPAAMVRTLTDASVPGWAHVLSAGGTFTWEMWTPSDLIGDSMSHGWGSSALVAMQEALLGVSLMEPGTDGTVRVLVNPPRSGLAAASGSVPTVAGPVAVQWRRTGARRTVSVSVPANAAAHVAMPAASASEVQESGVPSTSSRGVAVVSESDGTVVLAVGSGTYRFTSA